jgi:uncharacterized protein
MIYTFIKKSFIILGILLFAQGAYSQRSKAPSADDKVRTYVTDKTGTLTSAQVQSLETKLSNFDKETSTQVVVWMENSLNGAALENRSIELAEQNGIGQKEKNNGVLLYIAKDDRKLRIEVGYGLEGVLTDALSSQIIRKEITPAFKQGKFYDGINAGVDAIFKATNGEYTADKESKDDDGSGGVCCGLPIMFFFMAIFFIFIGMPILSRIFGWNKGKRSSNWWWTGGSGGSGWSSGSSSGFGGGGFSGGGGSFGGGGSSGSW